MQSIPNDPNAPTILHILIDESTRSAIVQLSDGAQYELAHDAAELQGLALGQPAAGATRAALQHAATRKQLARAAFAALSRRPLTRARLRERLARDEEDHEAIEQVLDQFVTQGLLDDRKFASSFVEDQLRARAIGPLSLHQRLAQQGVPRDVAEQVLREQLPIEREIELAQRALQRRTRGGMSFAQQTARDQRFLRSRGFGSRAIAAALRGREDDVSD